LKFNPNAIAFFGELLTIPFILAAVIISVLGFKKIRSGTMNPGTRISFFLLLVCTGLIIVSFF
jgi:hypothetical protein